MFGEFADKLRSVWRMDLLDGISNKALEYFSQQEHDYDDSGLFSLSDSSLNFKARFQHAQTLGAMGEVAYSRAKTDEAEQAFSSAKVILNKLYLEQTDNMELLKTLGANAFWLGQLAYDQSDFDAAQSLFELYRDYSERMNVLEPENFESLIEIYSAQKSLGALYIKQHKYLLASQAFYDSLKLIDKASMQQSSNYLLRNDKADILSWLATTEQHLGNLLYSMSLYQRGQQVLERILIETPDNAFLLEGIAYSFWYQARLYNTQGEYIKSHKKVIQAIESIKNALNQDPENEIWSDDLLNLKLFENLLTSKLGYPEDTFLMTHIESLKNAPEKSKLQPNMLVKLVQYLHLKQDWQESATLIEKIKKYFSELDDSTTNTSEFIVTLANFNLVLATQFTFNNSNSERNLACMETIKLLQPVVQKSRHNEYLLPYVKAHSCLNRLDNVRNEIENLQNMGIKNISF
jgi:tetratricopeptide (TPR) repeat protein